MRVYARRSLVERSTSTSEPALLLEGSWPSPAPAWRWSLDETIDGAWSWLDQEACRLASEVAEGESATIGPAWLNQLQLRYYMLKLLRVAAMADARREIVSPEVELHLERGVDEDYAELFQALSHRDGFKLRLAWAPARTRQGPTDQTANLAWRRWAERLAQRRSPPPRAAEGENILLCGSPRALDPVCAALLRRELRVTWFYDQFALRSWWRWRRTGARQWVCGRRTRSMRRFTDVVLRRPVLWRDVDLSEPVERWLARRASEVGPRQLDWLECFERAFRQLRPTALLLDEDATPLKRVAAAVARRHGVRSLVVQHGVPCVQFGFSPQAADAFCAWGEATRRQLVKWGTPGDRIVVTGWPAFDEKSIDLLKSCQRAPGDRPRILLLASTPARDNRPDAACLHATTQTYAEMLDCALAAVETLPGARLTIKLHPRDPAGLLVRERLAARPSVNARLVRKASLRELLSNCDCVLSCASTAGIEAALLGAPVVQLLPRGSADVLPATDWGLIGSARNLTELQSLMEACLARGWQTRPVEATDVLSDMGEGSADRVADAAQQHSVKRTFACAADAPD